MRFCQFFLELSLLTFISGCSDVKSPVVASVTSPTSDGTYDLLNNISIEVNFNETVTVEGVPALELETGATNRLATYTSGSGSSTLVFQYTVQLGDLSPDLDYTSVHALSLFDGTIKDLAGNDAELTLPPPGKTNSLSSRKAIVVGRSWNFIDGNTETGINFSAHHDAGIPAMAIFNNQLHAAWEEVNSSNRIQIRVANFDGTSWVMVDENNSYGLNYDIDQQAGNVGLSVFNNELYAIWVEANSSWTYQVRVKKFDGSLWTFADGGGPEGLNKNTLEFGLYPKLVTYKNELYALWSEMNAGVFQIRVKKFDGVTWTFVDGDLETGLNWNPAAVASFGSLEVAGEKLYAIWTEAFQGVTQVRVASFDGSSWNFIDGNVDTGLNKNADKNAYSPTLKSIGTDLYASWVELNSSDILKVRVKKYDGSTWTFVDGGDENGINKDTAMDASNPSVSAIGAHLYVSWTEYNGFKNQIRVKKFDGTNWAFVDGDASAGLNYNSDEYALDPILISFDSELYLGWQEETSTAGQIRMIRYH